MGALTEHEIFDCLAANFRQAAEDCEKLAKLPLRGPTYARFREELGLCEGACRQAAYWRSDARWLPVGLLMAQAHKRAGDWLRSHAARANFTKLAEHLRFAQHESERLRDLATGRLGPILPKPLEGPHRETRPVQVLRPSGLIVPAAYGGRL